MTMHTAPFPDPPLSRRRKAAMIIQLLLEDGNRLALDQLPEQIQLQLTEELANLRLIDKETVAAVATEFTTALEAIGLTAPGSRDGAISRLADHLSPDLAETLRAQMETVRNGDHWPLVVDLSVARLVDIMQAEAIPICAVTLSKLPVSKAAEVLSKTPGERARRITYAMSLTEDIGPQAVHRIGQALAQDYAHPAALAFDKAPVQRLGAILNATVTDTREDVLDGLNSEDPAFASDVRKAIFTFKDIAPRVKPTDIPNAIRNVDGDQLIVAIAAALAGEEALATSAEFILASLSQRMAGQLREDAEERGKVKKSEAETAMAAVTTAIREMVDTGIITLIDPDDDTSDE